MWVRGFDPTISKDLIQEPARPWVAWIGEEFLRRSVLDEYSGIGEIDLIGDFTGKPHLVRDNHACHCWPPESSPG